MGQSYRIISAIALTHLTRQVETIMATTRGKQMSDTSDSDTIELILKQSHTVAVVGLSDDPDRPSYRVAQFLQKRGYRVIPVNPNLSHVLGERAYPDLLSIPDSVDVVDIFRRSEAVPPIVAQAIQIKAKAIWMQEGIRNEEAAQSARQAGLLVVMDRCMMKEIRKLVESAMPQ